MKYGQKTIAFSAQNFRYGETQESIFQPSLNWESNLNFFQTRPKKDLYAVLNSRVGGGVGWFLHFFRRPRTELINAFSGKISFKFWWKQDLKLENWAEARKKRSFLPSKSKLFFRNVVIFFRPFYGLWWGRVDATNKTFNCARPASRRDISPLTNHGWESFSFEIF